MYSNSRTDLYDYLYDVFWGTTKNIYIMEEPTELTAQDSEEGFIVIRVGDIYDEGEFSKHAYGRVRCYVSAYIPCTSRGRVNRKLYRQYESGISSAITTEATRGNDSFYSIEESDVLTIADDVTTSEDNYFFIFVKSFIVNIDRDNN